MKLNAISAPPKNHDAALLWFAGLTLLLELLVLFHQLRLLPFSFLLSRDTAHREEVGSLVRKARSVQDRAPGSLSWYPLAEGDSILQNDTVMTAADSTATIQMKQGGELSLEPFTLLRFNQEAKSLENQLALEINRGSIKFRSRKEGVRLAFKDSDVELKPESEILVTAPGESNHSMLEVTSGGAKVERLGDSVALHAGQAVALAQAASAQAVISRFQPRHPVPAPGGQVFFTGPNAKVQFSWEGDSDAVVQWDRSPEFASARSVNANPGGAEVQLPLGKYYWRLTKQGAESRVMDFTVVPQANYRVHTALSLLRAKEGVEIPLRWMPVPEAEKYLFELSRDPGFATLEKSLLLSTSETTLPALPNGRYYWRVQAQNPALGNWPYSPVYDLQIKKRIEAPRVKGAKELRPKGGTDKKARRSSLSKWQFLFRLAHWWIPQAHATGAEKVWLEFAWETARGAKAYRLEVSARKDFKRTLVTTEGAKNSAVLEVPDRESYYWRVAAIDEDGDLGHFSKPQHVLRENARVKTPVPAPVREVAQLPPPPVVPKAVLVEIKAEPPEPPRARFFHSWVGYGGTYVNQNVTGSGYGMQSSGLPMNRVVAGMSWDFERTTLELHGWFQPMVYKSSAAVSYSQPQFGADVFWSRLAMRKSLPLGLGVRLREENRIATHTNSSVILGPTVFSALLMGASWMLEGRWPWTATAALEAGFVGDRTGYGVVWRNRVGLPWKMGAFSPAVEVLLHPQYRAVASSGTTEWNFEASLSLVLEWADSLRASGALRR